MSVPILIPVSHRPPDVPTPPPPILKLPGGRHRDAPGSSTLTIGQLIEQSAYETLPDAKIDWMTYLHPNDKVYYCDRATTHIEFNTQRRCTIDGFITDVDISQKGNFDSVMR